MKEFYNRYLKILEEELVVALGCTEPVALAYASSVCAKDFDTLPNKIEVLCSGNIIKNVKSVVIPNTNKKGIEIAVLYGMLIQNYDNPMDIFSYGTNEDLVKLEKIVNDNICEVKRLETEECLHFIIKMYFESGSSLVEIKGSHTNVVRKEINDVVIFNKDEPNKYLGSFTARDCLNFNDIYDFASNVNLDDIDHLINPIISYNKAIAVEGMTGKYGVGIGNILLDETESCLWQKCIAYTAAASEARMSGCALGVVTNSGSGNQGISSSVPIIIYGEEKGYSLEKIKRALIFSALLTIHQKTPIGRLSAFCGVVSATCASGAGISYLDNFSKEQIKMCISNTLANTSGIICDGAKPSCAAKISSGLQAARLGYLLSLHNKHYLEGDGIIKCDVEDTICAVGKIAKEGMMETDKKIINIMIEK